jgi:outer membrane protein, adhesin transport system
MVLVGVRFFSGWGSWFAPWLLTLLFLLASLLPATATAQVLAPSSIHLQELLDASHAHHPLLRAALSSAQAAESDVDAVKRQRWPSVTLLMESDGKQNVAPASRILHVEQTLWDFGLVGSRIAQTERNAEGSRMQAQIQGQEVHLQVVGAWQMAQAAVLRIRITDSILVVLQGYEAQMRRRVEAAASAAIDQELINARVLQVKAELASAESALTTASMRLEQMTGLSGLRPRLLLMPEPMGMDSAKIWVDRLAVPDWSSVTLAHVAVLKAQKDRAALERQLSSKQSEQFPQLYMRWEKPIDTTQYNSNKEGSWFVGLRYAPGAGFSTTAEAAALGVRLQAQDHVVEAAQMEVRQQFLADHEVVQQSFRRLTPLQSSVLGSQKVMESYVRQFQAGRKSWLDLLNAAREMAQSQYALAEVQVGFEAALSRIQVRMSHAKTQP